MRIIATAAIIALLPFYATAQGNDASYKERALALFMEMLQLKREGVFMSQQELKFFSSAKIRLPNELRGSNPPGGFFGRPPGSNWMQKMKRLQDEGDPTKFDEMCIDIPKDLDSDEVVCSFDVFSLWSAALDSPTNPERFTNEIRRFWLAKICHENPEACPLVQR